MTTAQIYRGIENQVNPEFARDETLERVIEHLEGFDFNGSLLNSEFQNLMSYQPILNSQQILVLSRYLKEKPEHQCKNGYLRNLIQTSFHAKNNDFIIDNHQNTFKEWYLIGDKHRKLNIKLLSETIHIGENWTYCNIIAEENAVITGEFMMNCQVEIKKDLKKLCFWECKNSTYKIHGKIGSINNPRNIYKIKLILNPEEYKKHCKKLKNYQEITLELLK